MYSQALMGLTYSAANKFARGLTAPSDPHKERMILIMRNRNEQMNIRLTPEEINRIKEYSQRCGLSISGYIRMLINGYVPKETPPRNYDVLIHQMTVVYNELRKNNCDNASAELRRSLLILQAKTTVPERMME